MAVMYHTSPQRIVGDAPASPLAVKQAMPLGMTTLESARSDALLTESRRYDSTAAYMVESKQRTAAMEEANAAAIARNEEFCLRLEASQAEAQEKAANHLAHDLAYYHLATETRRWPVSPVSTKWGIRQAPY
eukprot:TRINITY_DN20883_c0_g2_i1.p2 TRINITY_DN20883_c0_g2~~TRINITY_DN20883_c0_g2_i1.p2  ORF type:complete len:132 (+),score=49.77 TRINITY_DN20883_c0_g2_i1:149-544(+)